MKKTVLITGASRGIGRAIARKFSENDYELIVTCEKNSELLEDIKKARIKFTGDLSCYDTVCELFDLLEKNNISIDILINNAGISHFGLLQNMSVSEWNRILSVNLSNVFYMCKNTIPQMIQKKQGCILNISSVWGEKGASMEVAYSTSKGGLNTFTKALAKELAPSGIQVNAISVGLADTDMNSCFSKEEINSIISEIPAGRATTSKEIADIVYKVATMPSYMTGQIITVDGGWT